MHGSGQVHWLAMTDPDRGRRNRTRDPWSGLTSKSNFWPLFTSLWPKLNDLTKRPCKVMGHCYHKKCRRSGAQPNLKSGKFLSNHWNKLLLNKRTVVEISQLNWESIWSWLHISLSQSGGWTTSSQLAKEGSEKWCEFISFLYAEKIALL